MKWITILWLSVLLAPPLSHAQENFDRGLDAYLAGEYQRAYDVWKALADGGDKVAMFNVGVLHAEGKGVEQDMRTATSWYRRSAKAGYAPAQFNLGSAYLEGKGVDVNKPEALKWWSKAAEQNHPQSLFNLATLYLQGDGVAADRAKALSLYRRAADQGDERARKVVEQLAKSAASTAAAPATGTTPEDSMPGDTGASAGSDVTEARAANAPAPAAAAGAATPPVQSASQRSDAKMAAATSVAPEPEAPAAEAPPTGGDAAPVRAESPTAEAARSAAATASGADAQPATPDLIRREPWIRSQNPDHVTIQLAVYSNEESIQQFFTRYQLNDQPVAYFRVRLGTRYQYKLVYGSFENINKAKAVRDVLPDVLKKHDPWIRSFASVRAEIEKHSHSEEKSRPTSSNPDAAPAAQPVAATQGSWRRDATAGADDAQIQIGQAAFNSQDYAKALKIWRPLAERGVPAAQYNLGFMYESGWGVASDDKEAARWYRSAADQGHAKAQFNLGRLYLEGRGVDQNRGIGLYWIQNAADGDDKRAVDYLKDYQVRR